MKKSNVKKKPMPGMKGGKKAMLRKGRGKKVLQRSANGMKMPMVENFNDMVKRRFGGKV